MFTDSFPYRYINHQHFKEPFNSIWHNYSFTGKSKKRYIVVAEEFNYNVFAVKFYLQEHKSCEHKYQKLTGLNECSRVITTVAKIIIEIINKNPYASFVFIGSNSVGEDLKDTKRFRLYSQIIQNLVSPLLFEHHYSIHYSAYIMINRHRSENNLLQLIEEMIMKVLSN